MNETRRQLLLAARRQFARRGYDAASIRGITRAARANLGAVTYHFGSKEKLYLEVLQSVTRPLHERIEAAAATRGTPLQRIEAIVRAFFTHVALAPDMPALMLRELALERHIPADRCSAPWAACSPRYAVASRTASATVRSCPAIFATWRSASSPRRSTRRWRSGRCCEAMGLDLRVASTRQTLVDDIVETVRRGLVPAAKGDRR